MYTNVHKGLFGTTSDKEKKLAEPNVSTLSLDSFELFTGSNTD
jgi:hypothetical protein